VAGMDFDNTSSIYFLDQSSSVIQQDDLNSNAVSVVAGNPGAFSSVNGTGELQLVLLF